MTARVILALAAETEDDDFIWSRLGDIQANMFTAVRPRAADLFLEQAPATGREAASGGRSLRFPLSTSTNAAICSAGQLKS